MTACYQRADGTMLAQNGPAAVRAMLRWTVRVATGVLAAFACVSRLFLGHFLNNRPHH